MQTHSSTCLYVVVRLLPTLCFPPLSPPASVFKWPDWGESSRQQLWVGCSCDPLSLPAALTSMNSEPFLVTHNSAPAAWSLSCMVLLCWRLSNYITYYTRLGIINKALAWTQVNAHTCVCLPFWGKDCITTDVADINQTAYIQFSATVLFSAEWEPHVVFTLEQSM